MKEDNRPKCYQCKCLYINSHGWSDWTIEETFITCLHGRFEEFEQLYSGSDDGPMILAAKNCPKFIEGDPLEMTPDSYSEDDLEARKKEVGVTHHPS